MYDLYLYDLFDHRSNAPPISTGHALQVVQTFHQRLALKDLAVKSDDTCIHVSIWRKYVSGSVGRWWESQSFKGI